MGSMTAWRNPAAGTGVGRVFLVRRQRHQGPAADQDRHAKQRLMPAHRCRGGNDARGRNQQREPVAPDIGGQRHALPAFGEDLDAPGVDGDILGGRQHRDAGRRRERRRGPIAGSDNASSTAATPSAGCTSNSQPRRRPKRCKARSGGFWSSSGAQRNFSE